MNGPALAQRRPADDPEWAAGTIAGVLEIGNYSTRALIARRGPSARPEVLGLGAERTRGYMFGRVLDRERLAESVRTAVDQAAARAGRPPPPLTVGIDGSSVGEEKLVLEAHQEVRAGDLVAARCQTLRAEGKQLLSCLRRHTGGDSSIYHLTWISATEQAALEDVLARAGLTLAEVVWTPVTTGLAVLEPAARQRGALVLDVGAYATTATLYSHGQPVGVFRVYFGGYHLTDAAAATFGACGEDAELIKRRMGTLLTGQGNNFRPPEWLPENCRFRTALTEDMILTMRAAAETALANLRDQVYWGLPANVRPHEIVLVGGGALIREIELLVSHVFQLEVRHVCCPEAASMDMGVLAGTSAALGIAVGALDDERRRPPEARRSRPLLRTLLQTAARSAAVWIALFGGSR